MEKSTRPESGSSPLSVAEGVAERPSSPTIRLQGVDTVLNKDF